MAYMCPLDFTFQVNDFKYDLPPCECSHQLEEPALDALSKVTAIVQIAQSFYDALVDKGGTLALISTASADIQVRALIEENLGNAHRKSQELISSNVDIRMFCPNYTSNYE
jgi:hypothetical protein